MLADLFIQETMPAEESMYRGASFDQNSGIPQVDPSDRSNYMEGVEGSSVYTDRPGLPNKLDVQGDAVGATSDVGGWLGMPQTVWYDSERPNAGFPLPVPVDFSQDSSDMPVGNDPAAMTANQDFGIDDYYRFGQPDLNETDRRITERTFDVPVEWKRNPTFPAQIQKVRPWDRFMGAWPWTGSKDAVSQPTVSSPLYFSTPLADGVVSPTGAEGAMIPNTPSLAPQPMTWRIIPEQWADNFVNSGV